MPSPGLPVCSQIGLSSNPSLDRNLLWHVISEAFGNDDQVDK